MSGCDRRALEATLLDVEARLTRDPRSLDLRAERALLQATLGQTDAAREAYLEILQEDPDHLTTLINFGSLLYETDFRTAARTVFARAVAVHPHAPLAHVNLANVLMYADEPEAAWTHFEEALRLDPGNAFAHQRLSELLREAGEVEAASRHRRLGFAQAPSRHHLYLGAGDPVRLLVLCSTPAGDIGWRKLVDSAVFATTTLVAEFHDPAKPLPPHHLIFNAIGDADLSGADLVAAEALTVSSPAPVINRPAAALQTGRAQNALRLGRLPGVRTARTALLKRDALVAEDTAAVLASRGLGFPLLLRSPGFHTGRHFVRVERPEELIPAVAALPGRDLMAIEPLDARGVDGWPRKYRVMLIDGRLYPLHMAVSSHWKVHYFTGSMSGSAAFQAEEARFLERMPEVLGATAMAALGAIQTALGLDYAGVDFGLDPQGNLLLFEANAVMNIVAPDASPQWDYRRVAIARATDAARALLVSRAGQFR